MSGMDISMLELVVHLSNPDVTFDRATATVMLCVAMLVLPRALLNIGFPSS